MTLNVLVEENPQSWRAGGDDFYEGVQQGIRTTSRRLAMLADSSERRVCVFPVQYVSQRIDDILSNCRLARHFSRV